MARKRADMSPKSLANLKPAKKGDIRNPAGRKGKDGNGGVSLKTEFRNFIQNLEEDERNAVWNGLYLKAMEGDTGAIKLWVELNGERIVDDVQVDTGSNGPKIIIQMPAMEDNDS